MNLDKITEELKATGSKVVFRIAENYDKDEFAIWDIWNLKVVNDVVRVMSGVKCSILKNDRFISVIMPLAARKKSSVSINSVSARYMQVVCS